MRHTLEKGTGSPVQFRRETGNGSEFDRLAPPLIGVRRGADSRFDAVPHRIGSETVMDDAAEIAVDEAPPRASRQSDS